MLEPRQLSLMNYAAEAETFMGTCPDCSSQLEFAEGCKKCHACGFRVRVTVKRLVTPA